MAKLGLKFKCFLQYLGFRNAVMNGQRDRLDDRSSSGGSDLSLNISNLVIEEIVSFSCRMAGE